MEQRRRGVERFPRLRTHPADPRTSGGGRIRGPAPPATSPAARPATDRAGRQTADRSGEPQRCDGRRPRRTASLPTVPAENQVPARRRRRERRPRGLVWRTSEHAGLRIHRADPVREEGTAESLRTLPRATPPRMASPRTCPAATTERGPRDRRSRGERLQAQDPGQREKHGGRSAQERALEPASLVSRAGRPCGVAHQSRQELSRRTAVDRSPHEDVDGRRVLAVIGACCSRSLEVGRRFQRHRRRRTSAFRLGVVDEVGVGRSRPSRIRAPRPAAALASPPTRLKEFDMKESTAFWVMASATMLGCSGRPPGIRRSPSRPCRTPGRSSPQRSSPRRAQRPPEPPKMNPAFTTFEQMSMPLVSFA